MTSQPQDSPRPLGRGPALRAIPDNADAGTITAYRANAQVVALVGEHGQWPPYGSVQWLRLDPQDPRVYVATLEAAEEHRMHIERIYEDAHRQAQDVVRTAVEARAVAARTRTMRTREPHQLTATPGWPPIQIPGRPGEYLTYQETSE
ncbi:DUF2742 domain-containing protein [Streptomyces sp. NPDC007984]|uniref:DUF2742 domain-containing protein n=1 Tax=Streptomyces sp. NPDC007984 TaxID=3364801 RepID=UPI0036DFC16A